MHIATLIVRAVNSFTDKKKLYEFTNCECFNLGAQSGTKGCIPPPPLLLISLSLPVKDFAGYFLSKELC